MASNNKEEFVVKQEPLEDAPGTRQATPIVTPSIPSGLEAESGLQEAEEDPLRIPRASGLADFSPRAPAPATQARQLRIGADDGAEQLGSPRGLCAVAAGRARPLPLRLQRQVVALLHRRR